MDLVGLDVPWFLTPEDDWTNNALSEACRPRELLPKTEKLAEKSQKRRKMTKERQKLADLGQAVLKVSGNMDKSKHCARGGEYNVRVFVTECVNQMEGSPSARQRKELQDVIIHETPQKGTSRWCGGDPKEDAEDKLCNSWDQRH